MTFRGRCTLVRGAFDLERSNTMRYVVGDKSPKARDKQKSSSRRKRTRRTRSKAKVRAEQGTREECQVAVRAQVAAPRARHAVTPGAESGISIRAQSPNRRSLFGAPGPNRRRLRAVVSSGTEAAQSVLAQLGIRAADASAATG